MSKSCFISHIKDKAEALVSYYSSVDLANMVIKKDIEIKKLNDEIIRLKKIIK